MAMMGPTGVRRLIGLSVVARIALALIFGDVLKERVEIATPLTSLFRAQEGLKLLQLGISPYAGSAYHGAPLLLAVLDPFLAQHPSLYVVPALLADLASAYLLLLITRAAMGGVKKKAKGQGKRLMRKVTSTGWLQLEKEFDRKASGVDKESPWPEVVAAAYLLNPFTCLVCAGGSVGGITNLTVLIGLYGGAVGTPSVAAFGVALSSYLSLHPILLMVPVGLLLANGIEDCPGGSAAQSALIKKEGERPCAGRGKGGAVLGLVWLVVWCVALAALSELMMSRHGGEGGESWYSEVYGYIMWGGSSSGFLMPNLGLWWYFFTEMFKDFHPLFIWAFHLQSVLMLPPLSLRLSHRPLFLACVQLCTIAIFKPHPSVSDAALYLGLLPVFVAQLGRMSKLFVLLNCAGYSLVLGPVLLHLWLRVGSANANFYYAITLLWALTQIFLLVELVSATLLHDRELKVAARKKSDGDESSDDEEASPPTTPDR